MRNLLSGFDRTKVSFETDSDLSIERETAWYDITDSVRKCLAPESSVLEYVVRIEMDIFRFYPGRDCGEDKMKLIREKFEERVKVEDYDRFMCCGRGMRYDGCDVFNDAGRIRLTFKNGAVLISSNSEWGGITMM